MQKKRIEDLISSGTEIAGAAVGGALGFLAAGPLGAAALGAGGAVISKSLIYAGNEIISRLISPREEARVGGVLAIAADEISRKIEQGDSIRNDGFFGENDVCRNNADEVLESILLKSQREAEEKKIPYMGYLLANICFDNKISAEMAHQIIKVGEQLTYRQFCILRLSVIKENFNLRNSDYRGFEKFDRKLYQILYECLDLCNKALIAIGNGVAFGPTDICPSEMMAQGIGADLYNLLELHRIPHSDISLIANELQ